ncbi:MAG: HIT family protein [Desulfarculus sp.]|nr:HIT family protein [Desulfarculus sp.]
MPDQSSPCVFCAIAQGQAPAQVILQDELSLCILDIAPFSEGHCLVIPRRHVPWWHELSQAETASLFELARRGANLLMEAFAPEMVTMYARGRRIPHTHIFLVPTRAGEVLDSFFNALERFQESPGLLAGLGQEERLAQAGMRLRARAAQAGGH